MPATDGSNYQLQGAGCAGLPSLRPAWARWVGGPDPILCPLRPPHRIVPISKSLSRTSPAATKQVWAFQASGASVSVPEEAWGRYESDQAYVVLAPGEGEAAQQRLYLWAGDDAHKELKSTAARHAADLVKTLDASYLRQSQGGEAAEFKQLFATFEVVVKAPPAEADGAAAAAAADEEGEHEEGGEHEEEEGEGEAHAEGGAGGTAAGGKKKRKNKKKKGKGHSQQAEAPAPVAVAPPSPAGKQPLSPPRSPTPLSPEQSNLHFDAKPFCPTGAPASPQPASPPAAAAAAASPKQPSPAAKPQSPPAPKASPPAAAAKAASPAAASPAAAKQATPAAATPAAAKASPEPAKPSPPSKQTPAPASAAKETPAPASAAKPSPAPASAAKASPAPASAAKPSPAPAAAVAATPAAAAKPSSGPAESASPKGAVDENGSPGVAKAKEQLLSRLSGSLTDPLAAKQQQKQGSGKASATYLADSAKAWGGVSGGGGAAAAPPAAAEVKIKPGEQTFEYEALKAMRADAGIDMTRKEEYLSEAEFEKVFGKARAEWKAQPAWRQQMAKKQVGLF